MRFVMLARTVLAGVLLASAPLPLAAQERPPWQQTAPYSPRGDGQVYRPPTYDDRRVHSARSGGYDGGDVYRSPQGAYQPPPPPPAPPPSDVYRGPPPSDVYRPPQSHDRDPGGRGPERQWDERADDSFSRNEILDAGHAFFGGVSQGLASVVEYAFKRSGRPNGYILGEDAGGAIVAGLRYGEGILHTKDAGRHRVFWQGPSIGYDFGAEGSKVMVLVYNLRDPSDIYQRFGGVQGSAYFVGGVGIQFQKAGDVTLAPIRSGIGLRLGANVGYLKYTRSPTWNPF